MKNENFIVINGQKYDSVTGKPIAAIAVPKTPNTFSQSPRKAPAIHRNIIKHPIGKTLTRRPGNRMDVARSKAVSRFANARITLKPTPAKEPITATPTKHPLVTMGERKQVMLRNHLARQKPVAKDPQAIKKEAISEALATPKKVQKEKNFFGRHLKAIIFSTLIIAVATATYLTYSNVPSFSVKVASAQAGINATFPGYCPDGYGISGPVTHSDNQVIIKFKSNTDSTNFSISQTRSSWDSTAVKNKISKDSGGIFSTTEERGLTVYIHEGNAAWVNGGILYEIKGNALLSSYQVRKIATSL